MSTTSEGDESVETLTIDGMKLKGMFISGSEELTKNKSKLDALNVFPVPDGDTGTNMSLTMEVAAKELLKADSKKVSDIAKVVSGGSLRGARGNSGVILSQIFRGFAKGFENKQVASAADIAFAFEKASETAYKAVMKPKEGTILTIISSISEKALEIMEYTSDISELFSGIVKHGNEVLAKTPEMLPVLKQANVVDAGGKGLMCILEGMYTALINDDFSNEKIYKKINENPQELPAQASFSTEAIEFGYCTEFFIETINNTEETENSLKEFLTKNGDSIVVVSDDNIIKVHVHTEHPGLILEQAMKIGSLNSIKIENMRVQHTNLITEANTDNGQIDDIGFIAVAAGDGIKDYFEKLGVNYVISGGQTMNPSIDDILNAAENVNAKEIIVLPNNSNIILAAKQAAEINKNLHVLPTKTIPQGISAMVAYLPISNIEENLKSMEEAIPLVKTGLVTYAVRDTAIDGFNIKEGDILCMLDNKIVVCDSNIESGAKKLIDIMTADGGDILSIYYGSSITKEEAEKMVDYAENSHKDFEIELRDGGQPVFYYIISVE